MATEPGNGRAAARADDEATGRRAIVLTCVLAFVLGLAAYARGAFAAGGFLMFASLVAARLVPAAHAARARDRARAEQAALADELVGERAGDDLGRAAAHLDDEVVRVRAGVPPATVAIRRDQLRSLELRIDGTLVARTLAGREYAERDADYEPARVAVKRGALGAVDKLGEALELRTLHGHVRVYDDRLVLWRPDRAEAVLFAEIASAEAFVGARFGDEAGVTLRLRSGASLVVATAAAHVAKYHSTAPTLLAHVNAALGLGRDPTRRRAAARAEHRRALEIIARRDEPLRAWVARLAALGDGAPGEGAYRRAGVGVHTDALLELAADEGLDAASRAAAAIAAAHAEPDEAGPARVRIAELAEAARGPLRFALASAAREGARGRSGKRLAKALAPLCGTDALGGHAELEAEAEHEATGREKRMTRTRSG